MSDGDSFSKDSLFELEFMESLYQKLPKDKKVMTLLAELYTAYGKIDEGLSLDKKIVRMNPNDAVANYNLACSYSLKFHFKESVAALRNAVLLGYKDFKWMLDDPDLEPVRNSSFFNELLEEFGIA